MDAIIYARFSSREQSYGFSLERQQELCRQYAEAREWNIIDVVTDEGRSAWTGQNLHHGNLAALTERLERDGGAGKTILVENMDRIARLPPVEVIAWLQRVLATGVQIVTRNDGMMIDKARLIRDMPTVMNIVMTTFRAFMESEHKSERLSDAWARKRSSGKPLTRRAKAWVKLVEGEFELIPERAAIVRRIYEDSASGLGAMTIARRLNDESVPTFGRSNGWQPSYIKKILTDRAVIGEFQPHLSPKDRARQPVGDPIANYYPAAVKDGLFAKVQARARKGGHAAARGFTNVLTGLAVCHECDGRMTRINKGKGLAYLRCERSRRGLCSAVENYPYRATVDHILDDVLDYAMTAQSFASGDVVRNAEERLATSQRALQDTTDRLTRLLTLVEDGDEAAVERYRALSVEKRLAGVEVKASQAALTDATTMTDDERSSLIRAVRDRMDSEDEVEAIEARSKVKDALDSIVERVEFGFHPGWVSLSLKHGQRSAILWNAMPGKPVLPPRRDELRDGREN